MSSGIAITDILVTYAGSMAPPGYHRLLADEVGVDLNKDTGGPPTYLWLQEQAGAPPISEVDIVYDDEPTPEGWTKVEKNLARGTGATTFLVFKRGAADDDSKPAAAGEGGDEEEKGADDSAPAQRPLDLLQVVFDDQTADEGFEVLPKPIMRDAEHPVRLCFKRVSEEALAVSNWSAFGLKEGDWVDAFDGAKVWRVAQVIEVDETRVKVHYKNWAARWDNWLRKGAVGLAEHGLHTAGRDTGWTMRQKGEPWDVCPEDIEGMTGQLGNVASGAMVGKELESFLRTDLPHFVEGVLSSKLTHPDMAGDVGAEKVNVFLQAVLRHFMVELACGKTMRGETSQIAQRIFCCEPLYTWFYAQTGHSHYDSDTDETKPDPAGNAPVASPDGVQPPLPPCSSRYPGAPRVVRQNRDKHGKLFQPWSRFYMRNNNMLGAEGAFENMRARIACEIPLAAADVVAAAAQGGKAATAAAAAAAATAAAAAAEAVYIPSIVEVTGFCFMLHIGRDHYTDAFRADYFVRLRASIMVYMERMTDEMVKSVPTSALKSFVQKVESLFKATLGPELEHEAIETFHLAYARRLLLFPSLQLQLLGASKLRAVCEMTERAEQPAPQPRYTQYGMQQARRPDPIARWLTSKYLAQWLVDSGVAGVMLGDEATLKAHKLGSGSSHIEILKRSDMLLRLLTSARLLTLGHLELLWERSCFDASDAAVVHELIYANCRRLDLAQLLFLLGKVGAIDVASYSAETVAMVQHLTAMMINTSAALAVKAAKDGEAAGGGVSEEQKWMGLELLWRAACLEPKIDEATALAALKGLALLLAKRFCAPMLPSYLKKCVENVRSATLVGRSLKLLHLVVDQQEDAAFSGSVGATARDIDVVTTFTELEAEHGMLGLVLKDLTRNAAMPHVRKGQEEARRVGLTERLAFVDYYVSHCPELQLSLEQVRQVAACLVEGGLADTEDAGIFFSWITNLLPKYPTYNGSGGAYEGELRISPETAAAIFNGMLCDGGFMGGFVHVGRAAYICLNTYFRSVNGAARRLQSPSRPAYCSVLDMEGLEGLGALWQSLMHAANEEIARGASDFLVHLYTNFASPDEPKREHWAAFIDTAMERAAAAAAALSASGAGKHEGAPSERTMRRLLSLLQLFVERVASSGRASRLDESVIAVKVYRENGALLRTKELVLRKAATVADLRQRVAELIRTTGDRVRLRNIQKDVLEVARHNDLPLEKARIWTTAEATWLEAPAEDTAGHVAPPRASLTPAEEERQYPCAVLANTDAHFDLLFQLLEIRSGGVQEQAWELLMMLPTNQRMGEELQALGEGAGGEGEEGGEHGGGAPVPWAQMLDPDSELKLLYKLQIVEAQIEGAGGEAWVASFLGAGGFGHLYSIFLAMDPARLTSAGRPLLKSCLTKLIGLLSRFLLLHEQERFDLVQRVAAGGAAQFGTLSLRDFVTQLLEVLKAHVRSCRSAKEAAEAAAAAKGAVVVAAAAAGGGNDNDDDDDDDDNAPGADDGSSTVDAELMRDTIICVVGCVGQCDDLLNVVYDSVGLEECLLYALLGMEDAAVREEVQKGIFSMCSNDAKGVAAGGVRAPLQFFLPMVLRSLGAATAREEQCAQYFKLLEMLLKAIALTQHVHGLMLPDCLGAEHTVRGLCDELVAAIRAHPIVEVTSEDWDTVLCGLLSVTQAFFQAVGAASAGGSAEVGDVAAFKASMGEAAQGALASFLFNDCLFAIPTPEARERGINPPMCKSDASRGAGFGLLAELCKGCVGVYDEVAALAAPHHLLESAPEERRIALRRRRKAARKPAKAAGAAAWVSSVSSGLALAKSKSGYVGLKNLGCICYMNSTLQQLFMLPAIRHGILGLPPLEAGEDEAESMMFQLQRMFANLQESEKQCYNPQGFCAAFKDWEGQPVDVIVQQDIHEFLTNFFQQLENNLSEMSKKHSGMLTRSIGGSFRHELLAEGGRNSGRDENFYFWSLGVKGNKNLHEALLKEIGGEVLDDYSWEEEDDTGTVVKKQLRTTKRMSVKSLPNSLFLHLKRFEMDFETMQQVKINDKFEFPQELDMRPYTVEGRAAAEKAAEAAEGAGGDGGAESVAAAGAVDEAKGADVGDDEPELAEAKPRSYYQYQLAGVIVHMGVANSGHYYSYIKERVGADGGKSSSWFEFNDETVSPFDASQLESECFGGEETYTSYGNQSTGYAAQPYSREKIRNAFVLVYDRVEPVDDEEDERQAAAAAAAAAIAVTGDDGEGGALPPTPSSPRQRRNTARHSTMLAARAPVPAPIFREIWDTNMEFWKRNNINDRNYAIFMSELTCAVPATLEGAMAPAAFEAHRGEVLRLGVRFLINVCRGYTPKDAKMVRAVEKALVPMFEASAEGCRWLLAELTDAPGTDAIEEFLLEFDANSSRDAIARVLQTCLGVVARTDDAPITLEALQAADPAADPSRSLALRFVDKLVGYMPSARAHWQQNMSAYCHLLCYFCSDLFPSTAGAAAARQYLLDRRVLALSIHLTIGLKSPQPQLSAAGSPSPEQLTHPVADTPQDYDRLLKLVHDLALSCVPVNAEEGAPQPAAPPPTTIVPGVVMDEVDQKMVCHEAFLFQLIEVCADYEPKRLAVPIVHHLCWRNKQASAALIHAVVKGVETKDGNDLKPFFNILGVLLEMDDDEELANDRLRYAMGKVITMMQGMKQYPEATFVSIQSVMRLAFRVPQVAAYLLEEESKRIWGWFQHWLVQKRKDASAVTYNNQYTGTYQSTSDPRALARAKDLLQQIDDLLRFRLRLKPYDDEDDPWTLDGKDICIRTQDAVVVGKVLRFDEQAMKHEVQFAEQVQLVDLLAVPFNFGLEPPESSEDSSEDSESDAEAEHVAP